METDRFAKYLFHEFVGRDACLVGGTEAAGFFVRPHDEAGAALELVAHVRPDDATAQERADAAAALRGLVQQCVGANASQVFSVAPGSRLHQPQFVLVSLIPHHGEPPRAAVAIVVRCRDLAEARQRLEVMRGDRRALPPGGGDGDE